MGTRIVVRQALAAATIAAISVSANAAETQWRGFLWPVKAERDFALNLGEHTTLDACRRTAIIRILASGWRDGADWECGLNCKPGQARKAAWVCEDRRQ